ncbi:comEC/Rec2-related domain protein [Mycobacterium xenopi 3993]|nr:comEC/Rec2-related domain protein [Mycobacterium xenopi 3993]
MCGAVLFSARLIGPRAAVGLAAVALVGFVIVVQPTASVLRAALMGAIALLGMLSSRRRQAIPSLSAAVLMVMVAAPQLAVDVGFALSVVATAALVVIAPVWSRRMVSRGCPKPLADAVCVACAAQLVTAPLVAGISGRVSVVAAVANLAAAPVIAPITVLGTAAATLGVCWPAAAQLLIRFTGPELWWVLGVAHWRPWCRVRACPFRRRAGIVVVGPAPWRSSRCGVGGGFAPPPGVPRCAWWRGHCPGSCPLRRCRRVVTRSWGELSGRAPASGARRRRAAGRARRGGDTAIGA